MPFSDPERIDAHRHDGRPVVLRARFGVHEPAANGRRMLFARPRRAAEAESRPVVLAALADSMIIHFLRAPALVGGIVPSSPVLARAMSRNAVGFDAIVELGGGTGSVTRRLATDHPRTALTVIEREPSLARRLAIAHAHAAVREGCVHERTEDLMRQPARSVAVSSLPFRSLPRDVAAKTIATLERFLLAHPARRLVQYSYGLRPPFAFRDGRLRWRRAERVWRNVPPAIVWVAGIG